MVIHEGVEVTFVKKEWSVILTIIVVHKFNNMHQKTLVKKKGKNPHITSSLTFIPKLQINLIVLAFMAQKDTSLNTSNLKKRWKCLENM